MIGNDRRITKQRSGWFSNLVPSLHRYLSVDGGSGAYLFAHLAGHNPFLQPVFSPRYADLLIVVMPISHKLAPAVVAMAHALVQPAHILLLDTAHELSDIFPAETFAPIEDLFPEASHVPGDSVEAILQGVRSLKQWSARSVIDGDEPDPPTFSLPAREGLEMGTELAVLSLGPLQPFTSGPLRLVLMCDGEQVHSVHVDAGYAYRGIEQAMTSVTWQEALAIARQFDPLAPIASQLAYVRAVEQLQGWQPPEYVAGLREAVVALERAQNTLWWLARFAHLLVDAPLFDRASHLVADLTTCTARTWKSSPFIWIQPQQVMSGHVIEQTNAAKWRALAERLNHLQRSVEHSPLALRTRGIGVLTREQLEAADVYSGPIFQASDTDKGDILSRLLVRLQIATRDVFQVSDSLGRGETIREHAPVWNVPEGDVQATVEGPRGTIGLHLVSHAGSRPTRVEWQRPSAALLRVLPDLLQGQKLADVEVTLASLDLAMAEADG
ncbi:MAG: hypothetical protein H0U76_02425 [Ktedonobacteraceae bacterium]|nr:hypothetical protein [Ktedonobacteraceae bacterium]